MTIDIAKRKLRSVFLTFWRSMVGLLRTLRVKLFYDNVSLPWSVSIGKDVLLQATDGGKIVVGARTVISSGSRIVAQGGAFSIGVDGFVGIGCVLTCKSAIDIGDDALIAEYVTIRDQDHRFPMGLKIRNAGFECAPIVIGNDVWIAAKSSVLSGSRIGDGVVVGAHSLVKGDVPDNAVVMGSPARFVRARTDAG